MAVTRRDTARGQASLFHNRERRREQQNVDAYFAERANPLALALPGSFTARSRARLAVSRSTAVAQGQVVVDGQTTPALAADQIHVLPGLPSVGEQVAVTNTGGGTLSLYVVDDRNQPTLIATG